jgi:hypothetical protein
VRDHPAEVEESPVADHADADWIASTGADEEPPVDGAAPVDEPTEPEPEPEPDTADTADTAEVAEQRRPKRKGRSSVPSWDEIMFGGGKAE